MKNTVIMKGNRYGLVFYAREDAEFDQIIKDTEFLLHEITAHKSTSRFFQESRSAISFQGKELTDQQQREIIDRIQTIIGIDIILIIDEDKTRELLFHTSLKERLMHLGALDGLFFRGDLQAGQILECKKSIVLIGSVKRGAKVISTGNIVVLGALEGTACAGISGNEKTTITAQSMNPERLRIGDVVGTRKKNRYEAHPAVAYLEQDSIYLELLYEFT